MKHFKISISISILVLFFFSCKPDRQIITSDTDFADGVIVLNEGNFGSANSSVTHYDPSEGKTMVVPFQQLNGRPMGDVLNSGISVNGYTFLLVNNSAKVEIVSSSNFDSRKTLTDFSSPRYALHASNGNIYITDWVSNSVHVVNPGTLSTFTTISTGTGPEQIIEAGGKIFVANLGGFGLDSTITVIDPNTNSVLQTVEVGMGPLQMGTDMNGKLWILCRGDYGDFANPNDDVAGRIVQMDPSNYAIDKSLDFNAWDHPTRLAMSADGTKIFFLNGGLFSMNITDSTPPASALSTRYFYGLGVDPSSGLVYVTDPLDYVQQGRVIRLQENGTAVDSFTAGIIPGDFIFQ